MTTSVQSDIQSGPSIPSATGLFGSQAGNSSDSSMFGNSKSYFTYEEIADMTQGFSKQNLLGEGGFGCVYKGWLIDGRVVAVKQLKFGGGQGEREFRAEVEIISRVHHRHLVSLVGYCISEKHRSLVYEFVPNFTLEHHLHGNFMIKSKNHKVHKLSKFCLVMSIFYILTISKELSSNGLVKKTQNFYWFCPWLSISS